MNFFTPLVEREIDAFNKNWAWFLVWGIGLMVAGLTAIYFSVGSTIVSIMLLGGILTVAGALVIFDSFQFWWGKWGGFAAHFLIGLLYLIIGIMFIQQPVQSSISLTLLLGIFYVGLGIFRVVYTLSLNLPQKGWRVFAGAVTLLLGILILAEWPATGMFVIGLFIGIDLVFAGWIYMVTALSARASR